MFGIPLTITDIESAVSDFFAIPAVTPLIAVSMALPLIVLLVSAVRSILGGR